jgi:asparagine synthase (glutamine-hydrolysing)
MGDALRHRGPDDHGVEIVGNVGLVHRRLSIVDPSPAGHQPMASPDGRWWVTYNGETFNHLELRDELPATRWRGGSDTETLLQALTHWGDGAIERCNGLFAYAALDTARRRLLLVRDRFGVKPLYVARHAGALWFASEMAALLAAGVPPVARRDVLSHAVQIGWANGPLTPVEGVERVMPGTVVEVDLETLAAGERQWYHPADAVDAGRANVLGRLDADAAGREVEEVLRQSVRRRLMSDVPLGTMCSGGLDSSLITALAAERGPVHAFNAAMVDQPEHDEGPWARRVAEHLGVELHTVEMTAADWRAGLVEVVRHIEYPLTHESSVPMAAIAKLAHERGVKVLLSGEGADELFGGYDWVHPLDHADFAARARPPERAARAAYRRLQAAGLWRSRAIPDPRPGPSDEVNAFESGVVERATGAYPHHRGPRRRLEGRLLADLGLYLPHLLNRQDKSTMLHSIETRVPFLDPDVVSLALNLPLELRIEPERKAPLRAAGRRLLPEDVTTRPKVGFGFDSRRYLGEAIDRDFMAGAHLREEMGYDRETWDRHLDGICTGILPVSAEIWIRTTLRGESPEEVEAALWR